MKLYLSSYRIPEIKSLETLTGKLLSQISVALIPNAKDYYSQRAWDYKVQSYVAYFKTLGMTVTVVDLRNYSDASTLYEQLRKFDLIWAAGGNTFCLRYEMERSGFEDCLRRLLSEDIVYGGDSAGALVAGISLRGIEGADIPEFAPEIISDGLALVPYVVMPHVGDPEFDTALAAAKSIHDQSTILELTDAQVAVFESGKFHIVEATNA